ncbi:hypothetical protein AB1N83_006171 [Pleurotus pulmonarius]
MKATAHLVTATLLASALCVSAHGVITEVFGANGISSTGFGVVATTPRDGSTRIPFQLDSSIIRDLEIDNGSSDICGRTLGGGVNVVQAMLADASASGLPAVFADGSVQMTLHQVNADGAGPYTCVVSADATGQDFVSMAITTQVPGRNSQSNAKATPFPLVAQMPSGIICTGGPNGDACLVRCRNAAIAGPFGGCVAVTAPVIEAPRTFAVRSSSGKKQKITPIEAASIPDVSLEEANAALALDLDRRERYAATLLFLGTNSKVAGQSAADHQRGRALLEDYFFVAIWLNAGPWLERSLSGGPYTKKGINPYLRRVEFSVQSTNLTSSASIHNPTPYFYPHERPVLIFIVNTSSISHLFEATMPPSRGTTGRRSPNRYAIYSQTTSRPVRLRSPNTPPPTPRKGRRILSPVPNQDRYGQEALHPQAGALRAPRTASPRKRSATRLQSPPAVSKTTPSYPYQPLHGKYHDSEIARPGGGMILDHTLNPSLSPRVKCMLLREVSSLSKGKKRKRSEPSRKLAAVRSRIKTAGKLKLQKAKPYQSRTLGR